MLVYLIASTEAEHCVGLLQHLHLGGWCARALFVDLQAAGLENVVTALGMQVCAERPATQSAGQINAAPKLDQQTRGYCGRIVIRIVHVISITGAQQQSSDRPSENLRIQPPASGHP